MKPTLNSADIKLLKSVFATKTDLVDMEKRQDKKYATKIDLQAMEKRQDKKYATKTDLQNMEKRLPSKKHLEQLEQVLARQFSKLEKMDTNQDIKIKAIENRLSLSI